MGSHIREQVAQLPDNSTTDHSDKRLLFWKLFFANSGARKFRHGRSIVLSTKLVDGRACWSARRGRVRCTSVDRNAPTALLQFVVDLLENLFLQFSIS